MGVMWTYFRDTLGWNLIRLTKSALSLLGEGGGNALDDTREAILWLRKQFLPETSDAAYLPNYATSRSITRHPSESDAQFKLRVVRAWYWHYLGGKQAGLPKILALYGYGAATIQNWRDVNVSQWAEFWCDLLPPTDVALLLADLRLIVWVLNEYKPARSKLRGLGVKRGVSGPVRLAAISRTGARITLRPRLPVAATVHVPLRTAVVASMITQIKLLPRGA